MSRKEKQHWNERYAAGEELSAAERLHPYFEKRLASLPDRGRALDLGAGLGRHSLALARRGLDVIAVDVSETAVRAASRLRPHPRVHFCIADLDAFPLPEARFDVIVDVLYLNRRRMPDIVAALAPGGILVFVARLRDDPSPFRVARVEVPALVRGLDVLDTEEAAADAGAELRLIARKGPRGSHTLARGPGAGAQGP